MRSSSPVKETRLLSSSAVAPRAMTEMPCVRAMNQKWSARYACNDMPHPQVGQALREEPGTPPVLENGLHGSKVLVDLRMGHALRKRKVESRRHSLYTALRHMGQVPDRPSFMLRL